MMSPVVQLLLSWPDLVPGNVVVHHVAVHRAHQLLLVLRHA